MGNSRYSISERRQSDELHRRLYTDPDWTPFLKEIRLTQWNCDGGKILKKKKGTIMNGEISREDLNLTEQDMEKWIRDNIPLPENLLSAIHQVLSRFLN